MNDDLLRGGEASAVCLRCHAGTAGIPDVVGDDVNHLADRAGGAFAPGEEMSWGGHSMATGSSARAKGLSCLDCHDPHNRAQPRYLRFPTTEVASGSYGILVDPEARGLERYESASVAYATDPNANLRAVSDLCIDCHADESVATRGSGHYGKHPTSDPRLGRTVTVAQGDRRGTTDSAHWLRGSGAGFEVPRVRFLTDGATTYEKACQPTADSQVFCLTCHKAHGSDHDGGLAWAQAAGQTSGPAGCDQCHRKSGR